MKVDEIKRFLASEEMSWDPEYMASMDRYYDERKNVMEKPLPSCLVVDRNMIGDMLMASPAVRALAMHYRVDVLTLPESAEVVENNPYVSRVYTKVNISELRRNNYDLVLQWNTSFKTNVLMYLIGGKDRLGYDYRGLGRMNTVRVPIPVRTCRTASRIDECLNLLERGLGWCQLSRRMVFVLPERLTFHFPKLTVGMHVNCRREPWRRGWNGWRALADHILSNTDADIVYTGDSLDQDYIRIVRPNDCRAYAWPTDTLLGLAAVINAVDVFITVNSAPMHLAVALDRPTLALIGGTPARVVYPQGVARFKFIEDPALAYYNPARPKAIVPRMNEITAERAFLEMYGLLPRT